MIEFSSSFSPLAEHVGDVRRFVESSLADWERVQAREIVVLLASELAANVVVHAEHDLGDEFVVQVVRNADLVRVEVSDHHPVIPVVGDGSLDKSFGRELLLLDALATTWGGIPEAKGKVMWFEVQG